MAQRIGAQGVGLPSPLALYPPQTGVPPVPNIAATNAVSLPPGGAIYLPSNLVFNVPGQYSQQQILDPVSQTWLPFSSDDSGDGNAIDADGQNYRSTTRLGWRLRRSSRFPVRATPRRQL